MSDEPLSPASEIEDNDQFFDTIERFHSRHGSIQSLASVGASAAANNKELLASQPHARSSHAQRAANSAIPLRIGHESRPLSRVHEDAQSDLGAFSSRRSIYTTTSKFGEHDEGYTGPVPTCSSSVVSQHILRNTGSTSAVTNTTSLHSRLAPCPDEPHAASLRHHPQSNSHYPHATPALHAHDQTLAALEGVSSGMAQEDGDLFLQIADDGPADRSTRTRIDRGNRASWRDKRKSLPPSEARAITSMELNRPRTSGEPSAARPATRLGHLQTELGRSLQSRRGSRGGDDAESLVSQPLDMHQRRSSRYAAERQAASPITPVHGQAQIGIHSRYKSLPSAHNTKVRRPSQLALMQDHDGESPANSSEPKRSLPESTSADSQTAPSTVWDDLDDLKSRIKKLELIGKLPQTSGAAVNASSPQLERPRTATTAPTTIDSSPKRERKTGEEPYTNPADASPQITTSNAYPFLHAALAKAKTLLNPSLYRTLEATAADALQLASMSSTLTQRNFSSGASVANGTSTSDRQLRRRADMMCRNLTDLCLALCDGKHESPVTAVASPLSPDSTSPRLASERNSRISPARSEFTTRPTGRPLSRLEARRSSILGAGSLESPTALSPRGHDDDPSSDHERATNHSVMDRQRYTRASSRLTAPPTQRFDDVSGDEDPTIRAPSRVGSEYGFRSRAPLRSEQPAAIPQRSVSLREVLKHRRVSGGPSETNRDLSRIASLSSDVTRRRWLRESTPPVLEEETGEQDQQNALSVSSRPRQRIASLATFGRFGSRASLGDSMERSSSISSRRGRQVAVE